MGECMDKEEKVKGSVIKGYMKAIKKIWGKNGLEEMEKETHIQLNDLKDGDYYPRAYISSVLQWISKNHGIENVRKLGKATIHNLGIYKYLVLWSSMERLVTRAVNIHGELYNYGIMKAWFEEDQIIVRMGDNNRIKEDCYGWWGAIEGLLDITHTKGNVTKTKCVFKGDKMCEYVIDLK